MLCFVVMQEFLRNNTHSDKTEGPKTKSQASRNRRRSSRPRATRKSQATAKAQKMSTACERQLVRVTRSSSKLSSESESDCHTGQAINSLQMVPGRVLGTLVGDVRTLTYADRMKNYIAQSLIEDSENDQSRSPPTLSHVHSNRPVAVLSEAASIRRAVPCVDAFTPSRTEVEICSYSPVAKRRLFHDTPLVGSETKSDGRINADRIAGQLGHQNGYHALQKFFPSSLNGKSLGPVDHYEDGLLAIANAACLMSTGVADDCHNQIKGSEGQG